MMYVVLSTLYVVYDLLSASTHRMQLRCSAEPPGQTTSPRACFVLVEDPT